MVFLGLEVLKKITISFKGLDVHVVDRTGKVANQVFLLRVSHRGKIKLVNCNNKIFSNVFPSIKSMYRAQRDK